MPVDMFVLQWIIIIDFELIVCDRTMRLFFYHWCPMKTSATNRAYYDIGLLASVETNLGDKADKPNLSTKTVIWYVNIAANGTFRIVFLLKMISYQKIST